MRLLLVADLHYSLPQFDWVLDIAGDFDVVVMAGDHLDVASLVDGRAQSVVVRKYFSRLAAKTRLLICSGNHDLDTKDLTGEKTARWLKGAQIGGVPSDGETFLIGDIMFTICPWWDGPVTRAEVAAQLEAAAQDRPERWIWLYHSPPAGTVLCHDGRREFPDHDLAAWIEEHRPDVVLTGHIHQAPWIEGGSWHARLGDTWVFNAGRQRGPIPPHITLDTEAGTAQWYGVFDVETIEL